MHPEKDTAEAFLLRRAAKTGVPITGSFELTPLCNLNCKMCYVRMNRTEQEKISRLQTAEEWTALAEKLRDAGTLFLLYPFDLALFRAQLAARLTAAPTSVSRALMLNTATRRVTGADGEVRLSVRECAMLAALGKGGSLSRADAAALFGSAAGNVVDVYACYLRKKLGKVLTGEIICARRGEGYALAEDVTLEVL